MTTANEAWWTLMDESKRMAYVALYEPDGMKQWKRWFHSRCDATANPPILCPWCREFEDV